MANTQEMIEIRRRKNVNWLSFPLRFHLIFSNNHFRIFITNNRCFDLKNEFVPFGAKPLPT
jgi:hypothetical protein